IRDRNVTGVQTCALTISDSMKYSCCMVSQEVEKPKFIYNPLRMLLNEARKRLFSYLKYHYPHRWLNVLKEDLPLMWPCYIVDYRTVKNMMSGEKLFEKKSKLLSVRDRQSLPRLKISD